MPLCLCFSFGHLYLTLSCRDGEEAPSDDEDDDIEEVYEVSLKHDMHSHSLMWRQSEEEDQDGTDGNDRDVEALYQQVGVFLCSLYSYSSVVLMLLLIIGWRWGLLLIDTFDLSVTLTCHRMKTLTASMLKMMRTMKMIKHKQTKAAVGFSFCLSLKLIP